MSIPTVENEELAKQLRQADDMPEIISTLKCAGIDMTEVELLSKLNLDASEGELTEESLEEVSGGVNCMIYNPYITHTLVKAVLRLIKKGKLRLGALGSLVGGGSR